MDDTLKEILEEQAIFLKPYIFQFKKSIKGNKIKLILNNKCNIHNILKELDLNESNEKSDGIIIYELNRETIDLLTTKIKDELDEDGRVLIINSNQEYQTEILSFLLKNEYILEEEYIGDAKWNFLLYKKNTTQ